MPFASKVHEFNNPNTPTHSRKPQSAPSYAGYGVTPAPISDIHCYTAVTALLIMLVAGFVACIRAHQNLKDPFDSWFEGYEAV